MEVAIALGVEKHEVIGDSNLVVSQANGDRKIPHFNKVPFTHVPRLKNQFADALATLASMIDLQVGVKLLPIVIEQRDFPAYEYINAIDDVDDGLLWYHDLWNFVERGEFPAKATRKDRVTLQWLATQYIVYGGKLYQRSHYGMHKLCVNGVEATKIMEEIHEGVCGPHMSGVMLARKILRQGYFWSTMESQCIDYVRRCHKCQIHANLQHLFLSTLYGMTSLWPFSVWGINLIGMVQSSASNGHKFIPVAIDYFTKWVEAESYKTLTTVQIQIHHSTVYRPQMNGAVKAANKNVEVIIKKTAESARDWHEQLPLALWGYRMSIRTSIGAVLPSLVYGMEAVLPIELEVPSLRVMAECGYQRRIARAFNKKVKSRDLIEGDMVTKKIRAPVFDPCGKFRPKRSRPYIIKTILSGVLLNSSISTEMNSILWST
ncbi:uncharacterized protein LOC131306819 [Rhododendron vialii]|uniref:uncharacterized protein LOC131306819 n=1 Tax=Rhododendron vialii TaxID=182163 RepID=UPI00266055A8|nr:uncharacterized protein LOC131306819 [Rhododendron vialii]